MVSMKRLSSLVVALGLGVGLVALPASAAAQEKAQRGVITLAEVTITGRIQKPIAAVDVSKIAPKLTLAELEHRLERTAAWPDAALRIVVLGTLLVVLGGFGAGAHTLALAAAFVVGMTGAMVSVLVGRAARERGKRVRAAVDALVDALVGARPVERGHTRARGPRRG